MRAALVHFSEWRGRIEMGKKCLTVNLTAGLILPSSLERKELYRADGTDDRNYEQADADQQIWEPLIQRDLPRLLPPQVTGRFRCLRELKNEEYRN